MRVAKPSSVIQGFLARACGRRPGKDQSLNTKPLHPIHLSLQRGFWIGCRGHRAGASRTKVSVVRTTCFICEPSMRQLDSLAEALELIPIAAAVPHLHIPSLRGLRRRIRELSFTCNCLRTILQQTRPRSRRL